MATGEYNTAEELLLLARIEGKSLEEIWDDLEF